MNTKELNSKQIIRNINIALLTNSKLKEPFNSIYTELKEVFSDLNIYKIKDSQDLYYGRTKDNLYIHYDLKYPYIWLDYSNVWSKFSDKYNLSYKQVQGITMWYLSNTFHLNGETHSQTNYYMTLRNKNVKICGNTKDI